MPVVRINGQDDRLTPGSSRRSRAPHGRDRDDPFNEQTRAGSTLTQRAVHVEFFNQAGQVVREIVVAEAKVCGGSQVCDRAAQEAAAA